MEIILNILHYLVSFFLIGVILLQAGKGADIGATFGAGGSQTLFGPRGAATLLNKITVVVAAIFLVTSIWLADLSGKREAGSVLDKVPAAAIPVDDPMAAQKVEQQLETAPAETAPAAESQK